MWYVGCVFEPREDGEAGVATCSDRAFLVTFVRFGLESACSVRVGFYVVPVGG